MRFEALRDKAFSEINSTNEDDIAALYYANVNDRTKSLEAYKDVVLNTKPGKKALQEFIRDFREDSDYIKQFSRNEKIDENIESPVRVTESVGALMMKGIDVDWLMNKCGLETLLMLNKINQTEEKRLAEAKRMDWYMLLGPYIDRDKCKDIYTFFPLPWDKKGKEQQEFTDLDKNMAKSMLKEPKNEQKGPILEEKPKKTAKNPKKSRK